MTTLYSGKTLDKLEALATTPLEYPYALLEADANSLNTCRAAIPALIARIRELEKRLDYKDKHMDCYQYGGDKP